MTSPSDALLRERDFDFQEFREYAETFNLKWQWAEIDFLRFLYSPFNTRS